MQWKEEKPHSFLPSVAVRYGINAAVILSNIKHWIDHNQENGTNFYDGNTWTYNSMEAFQKQYPYLSVKQIRSALTKLKSEGIIVTGNYNTNTFNHTTWYALTDKGKSIFQTISRIDFEEETDDDQKGTIDLPSRANLESPSRAHRFAPEGKSTITNKNITVINTDNKSTRKKEPKTKYGEYQNVQLTDTEYNNLCNDFGDDLAHDAIKFLDEYIEEKGNKYKSHYLTIRRWVIDAVKEKKKKNTQKPVGYDWDNL